MPSAKKRFHFYHSPKLQISVPFLLPSPLPAPLETGSCYAALASPKFTILLSQPPTLFHCLLNNHNNVCIGHQVADWERLGGLSLGMGFAVSKAHARPVPPSLCVLPVDQDGTLSYFSSVMPNFVLPCSHHVDNGLAL